MPAKTESILPKGNPWRHATDENRTYLTPEDIGKAVKAKPVPAKLYRTVLEAIGADSVEDGKLCAFKAASYMGEGR